MLVGESRLTDVDNGADRAIALFLLEGDSEASCASVTVEAEGSRLIGDRVLVREDKDRRCGEREEGAYRVFHIRGEFERGSLFEEGRD